MPYQLSGEQRRRKYARDQVARARLRERGVCRRCASPTKTPGGVYCVAHAAANVRFHTVLREKRIAEGLCSYCGSSEPSVRANELVCLKCWFRVTAKQRTGSGRNGPILFDVWNEQDGCCAYTGEALVPGGNASLDHKTPTSRGGTNNRVNLQWVTVRVNSMKSDLTHDEFVALCRLIGDRAFSR